MGNIRVNDKIFIENAKKRQNLLI